MEPPATPTPPAAPPQNQPQPADPNIAPTTPAPSPPTGSLPPAPTTRPAKARYRFASLKGFSSVLLFVGGVILAATLINQFVFQSYYVDGTSMIPTLQNNDRLIIDKVERTFAAAGGKHYIPERGQIVVLDSSLIDQSGHNEQLIKRVIGLPGETVVIDTNGIVTVKNMDHPDGFDVNRSLGLTLEATYVDAPISVTIPQNQIFVMGDNRGPGGSYDSRSFGPVDTAKIQGRLLVRIFPLNKTGFF